MTYLFYPFFFYFIKKTLFCQDNEPILQFYERFLPIHPQGIIV